MTTFAATEILAIHRAKALNRLLNIEQNARSVVDRAGILVESELSFRQTFRGICVIVFALHVLAAWSLALNLEQFLPPTAPHAFVTIIGCVASVMSLLFVMAGSRRLRADRRDLKKFEESGDGKKLGRLVDALNVNLGDCSLYDPEAFEAAAEQSMAAAASSFVSAERFAARNANDAGAQYQVPKKHEELVARLLLLAEFKFLDASKGYEQYVAAARSKLAAQQEPEAAEAEPPAAAAA